MEFRLRHSELSLTRALNRERTTYLCNQANLILSPNMALEIELPDCLLRLFCTRLHFKMHILQGTFRYSDFLEYFDVAMNF